MDQAAEQNQSLQVAPDRITVSKAKKTLLVALTLGIVLVVNFLPLSHHHAAKLTVPRMAKAAAVQLIIDEAVIPPAKTPAGTSPSSISSPAETSRDELYQKGMYALINRQFQEAINSFAELQISNPEMLDKIDLPYAEALLWLAGDFRKSNPQQAITLYQKAIQLDPRSVRAHYQLGLALTRQKNYAAAIVSYQRAIEFNPQFPDIFFNLGFLYAASKNYAGAAEMYARTVAFQPDYLDEALFNLALAQSKQDKKEHSIANLKKALSVNPDNKAAQYYLKKLQGGSEE
ncbi:MAG: tetratricopeptide repeat protein [Desulfobulbaceae bacterium]|nr:tetratricopeptide repeat protein [Desulfobulbaceae bacterium]